MAISININNNWKDTKSSYCNINGVWRKVNKVCQNINGEWKCSSFFNGAVCSKIYYNSDNTFDITSNTESLTFTKNVYKNYNKIAASKEEWDLFENIRYYVGRTYTGYFSQVGSVTIYDIDTYDFANNESNEPLNSDYYITKSYDAEEGGSYIVSYCKPISDFVVIERPYKNSYAGVIVGKFEKLN